MSGGVLMMAFMLVFALWAPKTFGRHLAEIADAFDRRRAELRADPGKPKQKELN